jgi:hypothetical protein
VLDSSWTFVIILRLWSCAVWVVDVKVVGVSVGGGMEGLKKDAALALGVACGRSCITNF